MNISTLDNYRALREEIKSLGYSWSKTDDNKEIFFQVFEASSDNPKIVTVTIEFEERPKK